MPYSPPLCNSVLLLWSIAVEELLISRINISLGLRRCSD